MRPENKYLKLMNKNKNMILIGAVTLFIITLGCIGSTQDKMASSPTLSETAPHTDLSSFSLPENFRSLSDGLKLIPPGISWVYFVNLKQGTGFEESAVPSVDFYGAQIIGMLNSEYSENSWVELHDLVKSREGHR
jgi:hypothetical protein